VLVISGNIGAGKDMLGDLLEEAVPGSRHFPEPSETEVFKAALERLYSDKRRSYYLMQSTCLYVRAQQFKVSRSSLVHKSKIILGRDIYEDLDEFATLGYETGYMDEAEWMSYNLQWKFVQETLNDITPQHRIVLLADNGTLIRNQKSRGRECEFKEDGVTPGYLTELNEMYHSSVIPKALGRGESVLIINRRKDTDWDNPKHKDNLLTLCTNFWQWSKPGTKLVYEEANGEYIKSE